MLVPKAAVYEYYGPVLGQDDIRHTWKVVPVKSEAIAHSVEHTTDAQFGLRVLLTNAAHYATSSRGVINVRQGFDPILVRSSSKDYAER